MKKMNSMKLVSLSIAAVLTAVLALPAFADEGGNTSEEAAKPVVYGMEGCNECVIRTTAQGDIGLPNGVFNGTSQPLTAKPVQSGGTNSAE